MYQSVAWKIDVSGYKVWCHADDVSATDLRLYSYWTGSAYTIIKQSQTSDKF